MGKEAYDDYKRNLRDREANLACYLVLASGAASSPSDEEELLHSLLEGDFPPMRSVQSSSIHVGNLILRRRADTYHCPCNSNLFYLPLHRLHPSTCPSFDLVASFLALISVSTTLAL
jgi:hypothetical protein